VSDRIGASKPSYDLAASPADAVARLIKRVRRVDSERVQLGAAVGRVLAVPIVADRPSPAADVSAMDGFAFSVADLVKNRRALPVRGEIRIGVEPPALTMGTAVRTVTGAPMPDGADAVVKVEDVVEHVGQISVSEQTYSSLKAGLHIRKRAENIAAGEVVAAAGRLVGPALVTAMASFGTVTPFVMRKVRVAIISTGDEVVDPSLVPTDWQLRDGNGPSLRALLTSRPWVEVTSCERVRDDVDAMREAINRAIGLTPCGASNDISGACDALLLSGGVSMGHRDFVPRCLVDCGADVLFHKVPQRPGRPLLGAVSAQGQAVLALPGNPLSALVTARRIGIPVLASMAGMTEPNVARVRLSGNDSDVIPLWWFRLVGINDAGDAELVDGKGSGDVAAAARSEGFVEIPPNGHELDARHTGAWPYYPWNW